MDYKQPNANLVKQAVIDKVTSMTIKDAVTSALLARERGLNGGMGQHIEIAMLDVALAFIWPDRMPHKMFLEEEKEKPIGPTGLGQEFYEVTNTADGNMILMCTPDSFDRLMKAFNPKMTSDPRFKDFDSVQTNMLEFKKELYGIVAQMPSVDVMKKIDEFTLPGAAVVATEDAYKDPQVQHNKTLVDHEAGKLGMIREARPAALFGATPAGIAGRAPGYGEHTEEVLAALGYDGAAIAALQKDKIVNKDYH